MVSGTTASLSPQHPSYLRAMKRPIKALLRRSSSFRHQDVTSLSPNSCVVDITIPAFEDIPALDDDSSLDVDSVEKVTKPKFRNLRSSLIMQDCSDNHPLSRFDTKHGNSDSVSSSDGHIRNIGAGLKFRPLPMTESHTPLPKIMTRRSSGTPHGDINRHFNAAMLSNNIEISNMPEPAQEELVLYSFRIEPFYERLHSPHSENPSFLRMFTAEKMMLQRGKITSLSCQYFQRSQQGSTQVPLKRMGIVVAWPKRRRGRTWGTLSANDFQ